MELKQERQKDRATERQNDRQKERNSRQYKLQINPATTDVKGLTNISIICGFLLFPV